MSALMQTDLLHRRGRESSREMAKHRRRFERLQRERGGDLTPSWLTRLLRLLGVR